jgi:hypothetical protein
VLLYGRMDIKVYLPDALGQQAKEAELPLSRMLRGAVEEELQRRKAVSNLLTDPKTYTVDLESETGGSYTGRITGRLIAYDDHVQVYLADDERVILYDEPSQKCMEVEYPEEELREVLQQDLYIEAMEALGLKPIIDL